MNTSSDSAHTSWLRHPRVWAFTTYFTEGFPFSLIRNVSSVYFRDIGMSLEAIGLTSLFGLPWVIKFFWAHLVDGHATKRDWLLASQGALILLFSWVAWLSGNQELLPLLVVLLFVASVVSATHDIAIDGYYLEALDPAHQAGLVGYRTMAYRIALMSGTGVIVTIGANLGWPAAFWGAAGIMALFFSYHLRYLPRHVWSAALPSAKRTIPWRPLSLAAVLVLFAVLARNTLPLAGMPRLLTTLNLPLLAGSTLFLSLAIIGLARNRITAWLASRDSRFGQALLSYMDRPAFGAILAFIMLVKTGEYMLSIMVAPFMVDLGIKHHYGWISGGVGLPFSILGAMLGGHLIARHSLRRMSLPFLLLQNLTNLAYMGLALLLAPSLAGGGSAQNPLGVNSLLGVVAVHAFDQFAGGLGTAVLMIFLMRLCKPTFKAAHYAIGTGLMSVSNLYIGAASGFLAKWLGYGYFFGASFLFSLPGMLILFWLPSEEAPPDSSIR